MPCPGRTGDNLLLTVSTSTSAARGRSLGVDTGPDPDAQQRRRAGRRPVPRSPEPLFLALGRLAEYKRIDLLLRLWDRVRPVIGGRLVIAGDGPERSYLESLAGPGVSSPAGFSEAEKHRLLGRMAAAPPRLIEGWGIVVAEAAVRGTPTVGFDVPGLRDSVVHNAPACSPAPRRDSPPPGLPSPWTTGGAWRWGRPPDGGPPS